MEIVKEATECNSRDKNAIKMATGSSSTRQENQTEGGENSETVEPIITKESVKFAADSFISDKVNDDAANFVAEELTVRLKELVQEALKFSQNSKRRNLLTQDIDNALRVQNIEPLYGFTSNEFLPFRFASGGGREVYFQDEREIDLEELLSQPLPKIPCPITLKSHWLAIDGMQPNIPENPPPIDKNSQLKEVIEPSLNGRLINEVDVGKVTNADRNDHISKEKEAKGGRADGKLSSKDKKAILTAKQIETKLKPLITHELSVEQQYYYKEVTEACVGSLEQKRTEALQSLATDPGLYQLLPRFATFISEGVKINVAQHNLALLIYLLRMIKALMENPTLYLEKYLHELVPSIITCIVSKQLCPKPEVDNHWALRDFAARLMAQLCRMFNCPTNNIQSRITKTLCKALYNEKAALATHYGAVAGLAELGLEVMDCT